MPRYQGKKTINNSQNNMCSPEPRNHTIVDPEKHNTAEVQLG